MSLLKAWWGGGAQEKEKEETPRTEEGARGEVTSAEPEAASRAEGVAANPWVKGFGGESETTVHLVLIHYVVGLLDIVSSVSGYASNLKETVTTTVQTVQKTVSSLGFAQ